MEVSIAPELEGFVAREVESGRYGSADEVVGTALSLMARQDANRDEELAVFRRELDARIAASDNGEVLDAQTVLDRLRRRSEEARRMRA